MPDFTLAPICLFTYNRLSEVETTVQALKKNFLASESDLFIFSDGPKNNDSIPKVNEVRKYLKTIFGFKSITIVESETNKGLANSIISGVTEIVNKFGKVIVLEDDLITSPNFLNFMNQALSYYKNHNLIHSVSGYTHDLPSLKNYKNDFYLGYRGCSWGWGTWKNKWEAVDWNVSSYRNFKRNPIEQLKFMRGGSDMPKMLKSQMNGRIDSWAIRWCYHQFKNDLWTVFPSISKVASIGFGDTATHTKKTKRFYTTLDDTSITDFNFNTNFIPDKDILKEFKNNYSIRKRLVDKLH